MILDSTLDEKKGIPTRYLILLMIFVVTAVNYGDRATLSIAGTEVAKELGLSAVSMGYIFSAFGWAYLLMQIPGGWLLDKFGSKKVYSYSLFFWSLFTFLQGFIDVFPLAWAGVSMFFMRFMLGFSEAPSFPANARIVAAWFPAKERSIAVGYFNVGSSIGAMIAPPLVVWAIVMHSWQMAFIISGVLSFAWAIAWLIFYKHPRDQKKLSDEERDYIIGGQESQHQTNNAKKMSPWQILRNRQFWGIALPRFLAEPAWGTFNAWIPLFMFKVYGFNLKEIAMFAWMPMLFADLGCIVGGYLPPLFQRWFGVNLIVSRKMVVTMGALLMIGPGMIGLFTSPYVAIALLCIGGFAHQSLSGALITLSSDVFGRNEVATANGLTGMAAWTASTMFALVVGALADTIGFSPLFAVLAIFDLMGAVVIWTVLKSKSAEELAKESLGKPATQS